MKQLQLLVLIPGLILIIVGSSPAIESSSFEPDLVKYQVVQNNKETSGESEDALESQEDKSSAEENKTKESKEEDENLKMLEQGIPDHVQYCQGHYKKKGISGSEIITVKCPNVTDSCNCEVIKKNFRERVNCGGNIKNASKGSDLIECNTIILGN